MRLSVPTKLIALLVIISSLSAGLTGWLGYRSGRAALKRNVQDRMTAIRHAKAFHVESYVELVRTHALAFNRSLFTARLFEGYVSSFRKLQERSLSPLVDAALRKHYADVIVPVLSRQWGEPFALETIYPKSPQARYLQFRYMLPKAAAGGAARQEIVGPVETEYERFHAQYENIARNLSDLYGYEDILMIDADTSEILSSVASGFELGVSLAEEPYARTGLGKAVRKVRETQERQKVEIVDFEPYLPNFGKPASFLVCPVFEGDRMIGILAYRFPIDRLYDILSAGGDWDSDGLGQSGEVILIGADGYFRNESRFFRQNPAAYAKWLLEAGVDRLTVERMNRFETPILSVHVSSDMIRKIAAGGSNTEIAIDYLGKEVVLSYSPLDIPGLQWGIVTKITTGEAFRPVRAYKSDLIWTMAGIGLATSLIAGVAGRRMAAPLCQLRQATRAFRNGFYGVRVRVKTKDEVHDLASTFNEMAAEIELRTEKYREQADANQQLLQTVMPTIVTSRFRTIAGVSSNDSFTPDATLIYSEIEGYDRLFSSRETTEAMKLIRSLTDEFHANTSRFGIEELSSSGMGYLAACGLNEPHFDHTRRALDFALELVKIVSDFNDRHRTHLYLQIAIRRGPITLGNLGRHAFIHELWCKTISLARASNADRSKGYIRISKSVYDRISDIEDYRFEPEELNSGEKVWILKSVLQPARSIR